MSGGGKGSVWWESKNDPNIGIDIAKIHSKNWAVEQFWEAGAGCPSVVDGRGEDGGES